MYLYMCSFLETKSVALCERATSAGQKKSNVLNYFGITLFIDNYLVAIVIVAHSVGLAAIIVPSILRYNVFNV